MYNRKWAKNRPNTSNSKFAFLLLHEEELIVKKEIALLKEKNNYQVKSY